MVLRQATAPGGVKFARQGTLYIIHKYICDFHESIPFLRLLFRAQALSAAAKKADLVPD